jgi:hypothetical protein
MKKLLLFLLFCHIFFIGLTQTITKQVPKKTHSKSTDIITALNGQWRGFFGSNGDIVATGTDNTEYVLELDIQGTKVSGY